nr:MAG TPA: hypothetical protein [Caudoviricetes sp.]
MPGRGTLTSLTGCLDKYIICQLQEFVNFHLPTLSSAAASPIQFIGILLSISFMLFHTVHCFVIIVYFSLFYLTLYKYTLALFPSIFTLFYACTLGK